MKQINLIMYIYTAFYAYNVYYIIKSGQHSVNMPLYTGNAYWSAIHINIICCCNMSIIKVTNLKK